VARLRTGSLTVGARLRHALWGNTAPVRRFLSLGAAMLILAGCSSGDRELTVGVVDDAARSQPPQLLAELEESGFGALGVTSTWEPGLSAPAPEEQAALAAVAGAASEGDVRLFVAVYPIVSGATPLTPEARAQFAAYAAALVGVLPQVEDVIVGNEPNLNRFWLPQFGPNGEDVAAPAYLALLAETYDAVKAARADVRVWGGATAPRGIDRPGTGRDTHSPTAFIRDLGAAYRASGRSHPVMDGFVHHPYAESSAVPLDRPHPRTRTIGLADHGKLVALLGEAFDGTPQSGSDLPLLYGEIGVETAIPAANRALYRDVEVAPVVSEDTQAAEYRRTLELALCQPTVAGVLFFHLRDEPDLAGWQSGVRYVDGTPKSSETAVAAAALEAASGSLDVRCGA
jgi:hypothetical protein